MTIRLLLVCHAPTTALARAAFPAAESLTGRGMREAQESAAGLSPAAAAWCGPEPACVQTAQALGLNATIEPELRDCDFGRWRGRTLQEIQDAEPDAVAAWLTDPAAVPHQGESIVDLLGRVGNWLAAAADAQGRQVAVTHPAVIRAALVTVLDAPPAAFWRIDVPPLTRMCLTGRGGIWKLRTTT